ncbi:MAG TPA: undecaprenyl-diphosphate phosphatase [Nitrospirae bacterium]|nr:undecaprenyl-diphosphate phosphatase [Nitrospirota bacterium]
MTILESIIIGIVEGVTEFLPISSTGHMILTTHLLGMENNDFLKSFEISIQLGAILSVVVLYFKRFLISLELYKKLIIAFLPTAIVGFMAYKTIKLYLFNPYVVAIALIIGGIILIFIDNWSKFKKSIAENTEEISLKGAFIVGLIQCISMIPGVSRAGATIIGGLVAGLDRKQATEFSFFLAVPTMFAATGYDMLKTSASFSSNEWMLLFIGALVSFISAMLIIKLFIYLVPNYGFKHFGYYRIIIGTIFLIFQPF